MLVFISLRYKNLLHTLKAACLTLPLAFVLPTAYAGPTGGQVVSGNAGITQSGAVTNINQTSQKAIVNWQDFSVSQGHTVNFNQPNANASTLNRVVGFNPSLIEGVINANGNVFLVNPNGIVFSKHATINVGGLVASTRDISNQDFENGNYQFSGNSSAGILNAGKISIHDAGFVALLGKEVINQGIIAAKLGRVELAAGNKFTLNLNGNSLTKLTIDEGTYKALVDNRGIIEAQGGEVYLTTKALDQVLDGLTNNSGIIEAASINNVDGKVVLAGDTITVDGDIEATSIYAGNLHNKKTVVKSTATLEADFVETSGQSLTVENGATIKAKTWLLDPLDVVIDNGSGANGTASVGASVIETALVSGATVEIQAENDITVNQGITWTEGTLFLNAGTINTDGSIFVNAVLDGTGTAGLILNYGADGKLVMQKSATNDSFTGKINFSGSNGVTINGNTYTLATDANIKNLVAGTNYYLGSDITAPAWGSTANNQNYASIFQGFGHTISDITSTNNGLFTSTNGATISNLGLVNTKITSTGTDNVGALIGNASGATKVFNVFATGAEIKSRNYVGGIIGNVVTATTMDDLHFSGSVTGANSVGGLVGRTQQAFTLTNSSVNGTNIQGKLNIGGLVGATIGAITVNNATVNVTGNIESIGQTGNVNVGGLIGYAESDITITNAHATATKIHATHASGGLVGGLIGYQKGTTGTIILNNTSVTANLIKAYQHVGGAVGYSENTKTDNNFNKVVIIVPTIQATYDNVGGLVGHSAANSKYTIIDSSFEGDLKGRIYVGGFFGNSGSLDITNSYVNKAGTTNSVIGSGYYIGGVAGNVAGTFDAKGLSVYQADISGTYHVGGLAGYVGGAVNVGGDLATDKVTVNVENDILATGYTLYTALVGGFFGSTHGTVTIKKAEVNAKNILATHPTYRRMVGGLIGQQVGNHQIILDEVAITVTGGISGEFYVGGLIGDAASAQYNTFNNVNVKTPQVIISVNYVGGFIGRASTTAATKYTITNSSFEGDVKGGGYVGGLFGQVGSLDITNSYVGKSDKTNSIIGTTSYIGGVAGSVSGSFDAKGLTVYQADISGIYYVGGLAGYVGGIVNVGGSDVADKVSVNVKNDIKATSYTNYNAFVGGFFGQTNGAVTIKNAEVNAANILATHPTYRRMIGGLLGNQAGNHQIILDDIAITVAGITGEYYVGGVIGFSDSQKENTFNKIAVEATNGVIINGSYVGGFVGWANTTAATKYTITNSSFEGDVKGAGYVGGLFGQVGSLDITNSYVGKSNKTNSIIGTSNYVGGIAGLINGHLTVTTATKGVEVYLNELKGHSWLGGISGRINGGTDADGVVVKANSIIGTGIHVAGFAGDIYGIIDAKNITIHIKDDLKGANYTGGLFGVTRNHVNIENTAFTATNLISTVNQLGGLIGWQIGNYKVDLKDIAIDVSGEIKANSHVGGLIGQADSSQATNTITNAVVKANVTAANVTNGDYIGGFIGLASTGSKYTIEDSSFDGDVSGRNYIGGFFGRAGHLNITNSAVGKTVKTHSINGNGQYIGGIAGYNAGTFKANDLTVDLDNITAKGMYVGGLVGQTDNIIDVDNAKVTLTGDIKSLYNSTADVRLAGFFGYTRNEVTIKNSDFTAANIIVDPRGSSVGGLIGWQEGNYPIVLDKVNINVSGKINGYNYVGGVIGYASSSQTTNTFNKVVVSVGTVEGALDYVGGLIGWGNTGSKYTISNSAFSGNVAGRNYIGGLFGQAGQLDIADTFVGKFTGVVPDATTTQTIAGNQYVGGIAGSATILTVLDTKVNMQDITASNADIGGVVGSINNSFHITNTEVHADNITATNVTVGGLVGYYTGSVISDITNTTVKVGTIQGTYPVGGFIAYQSSASSVINIDGAKFIGNLVQTVGNASHGMGGIVGTGAGTVNIKNSFVGAFNADNTVATPTHTISGLGGNFGGMAGILNKGLLVNNQVNLLEIKTTNASNNLGGMVGLGNGAITITGAKVTVTDVTGKELIGGLIGRANGLTKITDSIVTNSNITGTANYIGGLVGAINANTSSITGSSFTNGTVTGHTGVGGVLGYTANNVNIDSSFATDGTVTGLASVGGLVGHYFGGGTTSNSGSDMKVVASGTGLSIGGFVGSTGTNANILKSYALGSVTAATNSQVGGFAGTLNAAKIENVYATGAVNGNAQVGGLVGYALGNFTLQNSYSTGKVTGAVAATTRGLVGQATKAPIKSYYLVTENSSLTEDSNNISNTALQLRNGETLASMGWDIVIDPSLPTKMFPQLRWACLDCEGKTPQAGSTVWVIGYGKDFVDYELGVKNAFVYKKEDKLENAWDLTAAGKLKVGTQDIIDFDSDVFTPAWVYGTDYYYTDSAGVRLTEIVNAGTYTGIKLVLVSDEYMINPTTTTHILGSITITPAQLTVTANDYTKTYDGQVFNGGAGVSYQVKDKGDAGLYAGDVVGGSLSFIGNSQGAKNAGSYELTPQGVTSSSNYVISFANGALTVDQAVLHVGTSDAVKTYDGLAYNGTPGLVYHGFVDGESATSGSDITGDVELTYTNLGSGIPCADKNGCVNAADYDVQASGLESNNYNIIFDHGKLTIKKANLTVVADNKIFKYVTDDTGTGPHTDYLGYDATELGREYTYQVTGFVNGEGKDVLDKTTFNYGVTKGAESFNSHIEGSTDEKPFYSGGYLITPENMQAANYDITYIPGHLIISPNPVLLEAENKIVTYNGHTYTAEDFKAIWYDADHVKQGEYENSANYSITIKDNDNQEYTFGFIINGEAIGSKDVKYVGSSVAGREIDIETTGLIQGSFDEEGTFELSTNGQFWALKNNAGHVIADVFFGTGMLIINKADLTIKVDDEARTYAGAEQKYGTNDLTFTGDYTGEVTGLDNSVAMPHFTYSATTINTGIYNVHLENSLYGAITGANSDFNPENYDIHLLDGTLRIDKAELHLTVGDDNKVYDGALYHDGNGVTYDDAKDNVVDRGLMGVDTSKSLTDILGADYAKNILYNGNAQNAVNVGEYTINASGLTNSNYKIVFDSGKLTITPKELTVTANDFTKTYDAEFYTGGNGVVYSGFVGSDTIANALGGSVVYGGNAQNQKKADTYTITADGLTANNGNYSFNYVDGALVINQANLIVKAVSHHETYDGTAHVLGNTATYIGFVGGEDKDVLGAGLSFALATNGVSSDGTNAGVYTITPSGYATDGNYFISYEAGVLDIDKAVVTVTATDGIENYKGGFYTDGYGVGYAGFVNSETDTVVDTTNLAYNTHSAYNAGEYAITASGLSADNYDFVYVDGKLTINKVALNAKVNDDSKTYDANAYTGGNGLVYVSGLVGDDADGDTQANFANIAHLDALVYGGDAQGAMNAGGYTITATGLSADNYEITLTDGALTVDKAQVTVTSNDAAKTYDAQKYSGFTVNYDGLLGGQTATDLGLIVDISANAKDAINAGSYVITPSVAPSTNYNFVTDPAQNGSLTIEKANLTVTANDHTKAYVGTAYAGGSGVVYQVEGKGDNALYGTDTLGGTLSYATGSSHLAKDAGTYVITPSDLTSANYNITFVDGELVITKAQLTATVANKSKAYDGSAYNYVAGDLTYTFATGGGLVDETGLTFTDGQRNAGTYTIEASGLVSNNYDIIYVDGTLVISKVDLTVTANDGSKTYDANAYLGGAGVTYAGWVNSENELSVISGTLAYGGAAYGAINAGTYTDGITVSGLVAQNYNLVYKPGTLTVGQANLTIKAKDYAKTYDGVAYTGGNGVTYTGLYAGDSLTGTLGYTGTSQTATNAGGYVITPAGLSNDNYTIAFDSGALTINQATLTVIANSQTKEYDATNYSGGNGVTYSGWVNSENDAVLGGTLAYTGSSQTAKDVNSYVITPTGLSADNYDFNYVDGALKITQAQLTLVADSKSKEYDNIAYTDGYSYEASGLKGTDTVGNLSGSASYEVKKAGTVVASPTDAGVYNIELSGLTSNNYEITYVDGILAIGNKPLVITATDVTKTYDGQTHTVFTVSYVGFAGADGVADLKIGGADFAFNYIGDAISATNAGSYTIDLKETAGFERGDYAGAVWTANPTGSTIKSGDYSIYFAPGVLLIDKADLTVAVNNEIRTYDGNSYSGNGTNSLTATGFVNSESWGALAGTNQFAFNGESGAKDAGSYAMVASGYTSNNYDIHYTDGSVVIKKAALSVTANPDSKTYDATNYAGGNGVTYSGFVASENETNLGWTVGYAGDSQGAMNAGTYVITPNGITSNNYAITYVDGELVIGKKALTATVNDATKTYDGLAFTTSALSYDGFAVGDSESSLNNGLLSFTANGQTDAVTNMVNKASGQTSNNYTITYVDGKLTVNKAALTITADSKTKVYDSAVFNGYTVSYSGLVNFEDKAVLGGTLGFAGTSQAATNAGIYAITPNGLTSGNYAITFANGALVIDKADVTVIANDQTKVYTGVNHSGGNGVSYQVVGKGDAGLYGSDAMNGSLSYAGTSQGAKNVANDYVLTPQGLSSDNYNIIAYQNGTLEITKAPLTVKANNDSKTYDATSYLPSKGVIYTGLVGGETAALLGGTLNYDAGTSFNAVNAGSYVITPGGLNSGNYEITYADGALTINKAALTAKVDNVTKTYDGIAHTASTLGYTGFKGGDNESSLNNTALSFVNGQTNAGTYTVTASGQTSDNYTITYQSGSLVINKAALTVTADNQQKVYDNAVFNGGYTAQYSGFVASESETALGGALGFSGNSQAAKNAGTYVITPNGLTSGNYAITFVNGALVIDKADLTVTANNQTKVYTGVGHTGGNGVTYAGFATGDAAGNLGGNLSFAGTSQGAKNVANDYVLTPQGLTSGNYNIAYQNGVLEVTPAALTVTANNDSKVYDATGYSGGNGVTYAGLMGGDSAAVLAGTLTYTGSSQGAANAGTYDITPGGLTSGNYTITVVNGVLTVDKAKLVITAESDVMEWSQDASNNNIAYDGTNGWKGTFDRANFKGLEGSDTQSVVNGLDFDIVGTGMNNGGNGDRGMYAIVPQNASASNYDIEYANGILIIDEAPLLVQAKDAERVYNGKVQSSFEVEYIGFKGSDNQSVLNGALGFTGVGANAGTYDFMPTGLVADSTNHYSIYYSGAELTVNKARVIVTAVDGEKTYNGSAHSGGFGFSFQVVDELGNVLADSLYANDSIGGFNYSGNSQGAINIGDYLLMLSGAGNNGNYEIVGWENGLLAIAPAKSNDLIDALRTSIVNNSGVTHNGSNFVSALERSTVRLMGMSNGLKTIVVNSEMLERVAGSGDTRVPLGRNSNIILLNGGVKLPENLKQEYYLEVEDATDPEEALRELLLTGVAI